MSERNSVRRKPEFAIPQARYFDAKTGVCDPVAIPAIPKILVCSHFAEAKKWPKINYFSGLRFVRPRGLAPLASAKRGPQGGR